MEVIRTWSYSRLHSTDVWDWESGDFEASDWPQPSEHAADVTYEDGGHYVLIRGVFMGGPPSDQVVPRQVEVTDDDLQIELEEVRGTADVVIDVGTNVPYELVVEFDERVAESDLPDRTHVQYRRNDTVIFRTSARR